MVLTTLPDAGFYEALTPGLDLGFEFLRRPDLAELAPGRYDIDGDRVYAMVLKNDGRGHDGCKREAHRDYLDIQYVISGVDEIGYKPIADCHQPQGEYDPAKDVVLFDDEPDAWIAVGPGQFVILWPKDMHAPLGAPTDALLHKVVVKVRV
jgi:YhcH/YjgK/YiaL family protein